jgi:hypothetical protein
MDNAGGHGTNETKNEYVSTLEKKYNVKVIWQVPNLLETSLLDLGVWCTVQSVVVELHRHRVMQPDSLAGSVEEAWLEFNSKKISKVHDRWLKVLCLIIKDKGKNDLVESDRGLTKPVITPTTSIPLPSEDGDHVSEGATPPLGTVAM